MKILLSAIALLLATLGTLSLPAGERALAGDANHDGALNRREWLRFLSEDLISRIDANHDGSISRGEAHGASVRPRARGLQQPRVEIFFDRADANGDGIVTRAELNAALARQKSVELVFDDYDIDGDLHLKRWEMKEPPTNVGVRFLF